MAITEETIRKWIVSLKVYGARFQDGEGKFRRLGLNDRTTRTVQLLTDRLALQSSAEDLSASKVL